MIYRSSMATEYSLRVMTEAYSSSESQNDKHLRIVLVVILSAQKHATPVFDNDT